MEVSPRLRSIAGLVPTGAVVADIGTGHGALAIHLVASGISPKVIATEAKQHPLDAARRAVGAAGLAGAIQVRAGWGLEPLKPGEADCIVISGMGGDLIARIISRSRAIAGDSRLVLGPMVRQGLLRGWLLKNNYRICDEDLCIEGGRVYETIAATPGRERLEGEVFLEVGPRLWEMRHPLLARHLDAKIDVYRRLLREMARSRRPEVVSCSEAYRLKMEDIMTLREELRSETQGQ